MKSRTQSRLTWYYLYDVDTMQYTRKKARMSIDQLLIIHKISTKVARNALWEHLRIFVIQWKSLIFCKKSWEKCTRICLNIQKLHYIRNMDHLGRKCYNRDILASAKEYLSSKWNRWFKLGQSPKLLEPHYFWAFAIATVKLPYFHSSWLWTVFVPRTFHFNLHL